MSGFSLKEASSQIVDNPSNTIFLEQALDTNLKFYSINISTNYPEIKNKSFAYFTMLYQRMANQDTGLHSFDLYTSTQNHKSGSNDPDPRNWHQIFYKRTDDSNEYHWYSANLFLPIVQDQDGESYINLQAVAGFGGQYYFKLYMRGGIG